MFIDSKRLSNQTVANSNLVQLCWYKDKDIQIWFSTEPIIVTKNANSQIQSKEEFDKIRKWPFVLKHLLFVQIQDTRKSEVRSYSFRINTDYSYDGATIIRFAWRLIGAPSDPRFLVGALLHDVLCQHHDYVNNDRRLSTTVLDSCCKVAGTGWFTRFLMFWLTDIYQNLFRGW